MLVKIPKLLFSKRVRSYENLVGVIFGRLEELLKLQLLPAISEHMYTL